jgi:hypothetical protein
MYVTPLSTIPRTKEENTNIQTDIDEIYILIKIHVIYTYTYTMPLLFIISYPEVTTNLLFPTGAKFTYKNK